LSITVTQLRHLLSSFSGTFVLGDNTLGVDAVKSLFDKCLPSDTLTLASASADLTALTVQGTISLAGVGSSSQLAAAVTFTTDSTQTDVTGLVIAVTLDTWKVATNYLTVDVTFLTAMPTKAVRLLLSAEPDGSDPAAPEVGLQADFPLTVDSDTKTLTVSGTAPPPPAGNVPASSNWVLAATFEGISLADLGALVQLVPKLQTADVQLPSQIPVLDQVDLCELRLVFDPQAGAVVAVLVDVRVNSSWPLIPKVCELSEVHARVSVAAPTYAPRVAISIYGTVTVAAMQLLASIGIPVSIAESGLQLLVELEEPVRAPAVFSQYLPAAAVDLDVQELLLSVDVVSLNYDVAFGVGAGSTGAWRLPGGVSLQDAYVTVSGTGVGTPSGSATAGFDVGGGATVVLGGRYGSSGWTLTGDVLDSTGLDVGHLMASLASQFNVTVPAPLADLVLTDVKLTVTEAGPGFDFVCTGKFPIGKAQADLTASLGITGRPFRVAAGGTLTLRIPVKDGPDTTMAFVVTFEEGSSTQFTAIWSDEPGVGLGDLAALLGIDVSGVPSDHLPTLTSLKLSYDSSTSTVILVADDEAALVIGKDTAGDWVFLFGIAVGVALAVDLTDIPVIGKLVPPGAAGISLSQLRIVGATTALPSYDATPDLERIIGPAITSGLALSAKLTVGTEFQDTLSVRFGGADDNSQSDVPRGQSTAPPLAASAGQSTALVLAAAGVSPAPQATWINVQRAFGPVQFARIGLALTDGSSLSLLVDGSVSLAGLTIGLIGLEATMALESPYVPTFDLAGLQVGFAGGGVDISGGLEKVPGCEPAEFTGELAVILASFGLTVLGSYTTVHGQPSLFAFLFLDAPLGGPPFFFVTGLAGGFGYNRTLQLPTIDAVATFPLVAGATGQLNSKQTEQQLNALISPALGEDWLAAGVKFTSFETVSSFALVTVAFGTHFEVALMGESTISVPPAAPGETVTPTAQAQMVLLVDVDPSNGQVAVSAQLTPQSYVLEQAARLTGGFAFYVWFAPSAHAGDFVVTLGGYNPYFTPPDYYPNPPRLGLDWKLSDKLTVKGGLYFALTASVVMAGGELQATWSSGDLSAWFDAQADFLIRFKPFQYLIHVSVSIGVSLTVNLLVTTKRITVHVGVDVALWGPPFGGTAHVDLSIISFTIDFGSRQPPPLPNISWPEFRGSFLPAANPSERAGPRPGPRGPRADPTPTDTVITLAAAQGLLGTQDSTWLVDPTHLRIEVATQVPSTTARVTSTDTEPPAGQWNGRLGIGPMGAAPGSITSSLTITLTRAEGGPDSWQATAVNGNVPAGLWQNTSNTMQTQGLVEGVLSGVSLVPAPPAGGQTRPVPLSELETSDPTVRPVAWSAARVPDSDAFDQHDALAIMASSLIDPDIAATRTTVLAGLRAQGLTTAGSVEVGSFAANAANLLASPPQLRLLGEEVSVA
jgi:hypothetical protein